MMRKLLIWLGCFTVIVIAVCGIAKEVIITSDSMEYPVPQDGKWVCEEHGIVLSFDEDDPYSTIMIDGRIVTCLAGNERYTPDIYLICQDPNDPDFYLAEELFAGRIIEFGENKFTLVENKTDIAYIFIKQE